MGVLVKGLRISWRSVMVLFLLSSSAARVLAAKIQMYGVSVLFLKLVVDGGADRRFLTCGRIGCINTQRLGVIG